MKQTIKRLQFRVSVLWNFHIVFIALEVLSALIKLYLYLHK